jgi:hypothetical protein
MSQVKEEKRAVEPVKQKANHHVRIALKHLTTRREIVLAKRAQLTKEIEELDAAILALE